MYELNRTTFQRLVQLQGISLLIYIVAVMRTVLSDRWLGFEIDFEVAATKYFGPDLFGDDTSWLLIAVIAGLSVWTIASMIGLFWFYRWARFGFWASAVTLFILSLALIGDRPTYTASLDDALLTLNSASFGAIVLLSYAKGFGATWFARPMPRVED